VGGHQYHPHDGHTWLVTWASKTFLSGAKLQVCDLSVCAIVYSSLSSGDFGDFASFVSHMKDIAKVQVFYILGVS